MKTGTQSLEYGFVGSSTNNRQHEALEMAEMLERLGVGRV